MQSERLWVTAAMGINSSAASADVCRPILRRTTHYIGSRQPSAPLRMQQWRPRHVVPGCRALYCNTMYNTAREAYGWGRVRHTA